MTAQGRLNPTTRNKMPPQLEEDAQALSQALADVEEPSSSVALETPPADIRRSGRERSSTVIHVDGHVVKKQNFYQVKGHEYVYGTIEGHHAAPRPKSIPVFHGPKPAPKPRVATAQELDRRSRKLSTERLIQEKLAARQSFLKENIMAMAPFLEPKIVTKLDGFSAKVREDDFLAAKPQSIIADLRDYQLEGLQWMASMYRKNMGIILGDEMGLGKTLQSIALISHIKEKYGRTGPSLVVCPLSVLYSWCAEIEKWAPSLKFLRFHGSNVESMDFPNLSAYDIVVTTYEMVKVPKLRNLIWARNHFNLLILDEGQRIKGADTHIAKAVRLIHCESRVILTGTVLSNNLVELWSLLNFLVPDVFTVQEPFVDAFDLAHNRVDKEKLKNAYKLLKIFMLRRLKAEVEKLMPKKVETKVICPLSRDQIWWYKAVLMKDIGLLASSERSVGGNKAKVLNNLVMQLRKVCLHPGLFMKDDPAVDETVEELVGASGKLTVLDKLLRSLYQKGHRVVLFSQFTSVLDILEDYCAMRGWDHCRFDGSTARARRNYVVQSFNKAESSKFIFLMSTRSGGVGLNLQTADTVVLFDSDWNPQPDIQAMARVHRIGQTKTVHVYRLVTEGTVEQRMIERAEKKLYLDKMVTRDGSVDVGFEEDDGDSLLKTLKFGCDAVFGKGDDRNRLPSDEDIELITDRTRSDDFSQGKLKGSSSTSAQGFDATKQFTGTMEFGGIDFTAIRDKYQKEKPEGMNAIANIWRKKRERKNRIKFVEAKGSGWGSAAPVLTANDYDLETGERSVFQQELLGRSQAATKAKKGPPFDENQSHCQVCGDGGYIVCCPRCPVSLHLKCANVRKLKDFACCTHHHCSVCGKSASSSGGMLFPCNACPFSYCEDHLPEDFRFVESNRRMEDLGFHFHMGVYVHCSGTCEAYAVKELGFKRPSKVKKAPCPAMLDVSTHFGGTIDDTLSAPDDLLVSGKRRRKKVNYAGDQTKKAKSAMAPAVQAQPLVISLLDDSPASKLTKKNEESADRAYAPSSDDEVEVLEILPPAKQKGAAYDRSHCQQS